MLIYLKTTILKSALFFYLFIFSVVLGVKPDEAERYTSLQSVLPFIEEKEIPLSFVIDLFSSDSLELYEDIPDKFEYAYEKKDYSSYKKLFVTKKRINDGVAFYNKNVGIIKAVYDSLGVDPFLILSISGVESNFGTHPGKYEVFNALYTIVSSIPKRKNWASKELVEFIDYCYRDNVQAYSVTGSYAGAFGFGQFIPSSFNQYTVDFDGDGVRRFNEWGDVLASISNYLLKNGYETGGPFTKGSRNWKSVYAYNHSENYVRAVLDLRLEYKERITKN